MMTPSYVQWLHDADEDAVRQWHERLYNVQLLLDGNQLSKVIPTLQATAAHSHVHMQHVPIIKIGQLVLCQSHHCVSEQAITVQMTFF